MKTDEFVSAVREHDHWCGDHQTGKRLQMSMQTIYDVHMTEADLVRATFFHCEFQSCDLTNAYLVGARFVECRFQDVLLGGSDLAEADFTACTFSGVEFKGARFEDTRLKSNIWGYTVMDDCHGFLQLGPIGSRGDTLRVVVGNQDDLAWVSTGCWHSNLRDFHHRVQAIYPLDADAVPMIKTYALEYHNACAYIDIWARIVRDAHPQDR